MARENKFELKPSKFFISFFRLSPVFIKISHKTPLYGFDVNGKSILHGIPWWVTEQKKSLDTIDI